jgi:prepilin-type N-terminal cleavage/methylation domain-containing protein
MKKGGTSVAGFTIIEVMIVLAVTGILFAAAVTLIAGRQNKTEFTQAINQVQSQIQQVMDNVSNGYYASQQNFTCLPGNSAPPTITTTSSNRGSNNGCIFFGKVMQFETGNTINSYTIIGNQTATGGLPAQSFTESGVEPILLAPDSGSSTVPWEKDQVYLEYGLTVASMQYNNTNIGAIAVASSPSNPSTSYLTSGPQQVNITPIPGTSISDPDPSQLPGGYTTIRNINTALQGSTIGANSNPSGGIKICFKSGTTNQSGLITIGGNNQQALVTLAVKSSTDCT